MPTLAEALAHARHLLDHGRPAEAEALWRQVLAVQPDNAQALHYLGTLALQDGRNDLAVELLGRLVAGHPDVAGFQANFALALARLALRLQEQGRVGEALAHYRQAIAIQPDLTEAHINLANALWHDGQTEEAIASLRPALALEPAMVEGFRSLGHMLRRQGRRDEAAAAYRRALDLGPEQPDVLLALGNALFALDRPADAAEAYRRTMARQPDHADALSNLGYALKCLGDLDGAVAAYQRAIALAPGLANPYYNFGITLQTLGRFDAAETSFRRAVTLDPGHVGARHLLGRMRLLKGDLREGGAEYEWRPNNAKFREMVAREAAAGKGPPLWDGRPIPDGTIGLIAEGGFGDAIHFIRYVPRVAGLCRQVVVVCRPELERLFASLVLDPATAGRVRINPDPLPPVHARAMFLSLPHLMGTTLETIPADIPYLQAEPDLARTWARRLAPYPGLKVGLVWAGGPGGPDDLLRSLDLEHFAGLGRIPNVTLVSIQKGPTEGRAASPPEGMALLNLSPEIRDFADTAAIVHNLDLVIAVDTSVVHLAGALGRPVWTLVTYLPDFRWLLGREDSPWYPTLRLFRQPAPGVWEPAVEQVVQALAVLAGDGPASGGAGR